MHTLFIYLFRNVRNECIRTYQTIVEGFWYNIHSQRAQCIPNKHIQRLKSPQGTSPEVRVTELLIELMWTLLSTHSHTYKDFAEDSCVAMHCLAFSSAQACYHCVGLPFIFAFIYREIYLWFSTHAFGLHLCLAYVVLFAWSLDLDCFVYTYQVLINRILSMQYLSVPLFEQFLLSCTPY